MFNKFRPRYDGRLVRQDAGAKGWDDSRLAREAGKGLATVSDFLSGERQTPPTALAIANALGYKTPARYLLPLKSKRVTHTQSVGAR